MRIMMKGGILVFGCVCVFVSCLGQRRDEEAMRVMNAPLSHPVTVSAGGIRVELRGVYICDGLLWLSFSASNRSSIDFRGNAVRLEIRGRRAFKRRASQEVGLRVAFRGEPSVVRADSVVRFCVAVAPRVPGKEQEMVAEWVERDGDRRVVLRVNGKRVLRAKRV
jgi:hypothetical protein